MAKAARPPRAGVSYVTTATYGRRPIFEISRVASLFVETLLHYRTLGHYKLHAYVILPDQIHLLLTPQSITLDQAMGLIRTGFTHRLETDLPVWEEDFTAYSVANMHDLEAARTFLHQLPVRAGIVSAAELYPHSSAYHTTLPMPSLAEARALTSEADSQRKSADSESTQPDLRKVAS
ncbi:MAG: transposase [Acidobacteriota bacterium]|nr:transposase [Acidobacteriota bacterium]